VHKKLEVVYRSCMLCYAMLCNAQLPSHTDIELEAGRGATLHALTGRVGGSAVEKVVSLASSVETAGKSPVSHQISSSLQQGSLGRRVEGSFYSTFTASW
jgi:hypothetical protein